MLTLGTDPPDLPVAATPLQLTAGARSGHGHCHGCWGQSVHKGRLASPCIQNKTCSGPYFEGYWRYRSGTTRVYLGSSLCQRHWSHVGWWNSSSGDSWTGVGTEFDSDMRTALRSRNFWMYRIRRIKTASTSDLWPYLFYDHFSRLAYRLHDLPSCPAHPHLPRGQPPQPRTWGGTGHGPGARQPCQGAGTQEAGVLRWPSFTFENGKITGRAGQTERMEESKEKGRG